MFCFVFESPLKQVRSGGEIWGNSGVCLSGVKRSEFSRGPNFPEHRSGPRRGCFTWGALFRFLFWASKKEQKLILSWPKASFIIVNKTAF